MTKLVLQQLGQWITTMSFGFVGGTYEQSITDDWRETNQNDSLHI
jgi:hypothetical protein